MRWYIEHQFPSVWTADSQPTLEDIDCWRLTLSHLVSELEFRFHLPFSWTDLGSLELGIPSASSPTWCLFSHRVFAAYYVAESVRQSAQGKCRSTRGTGRKFQCSLPLPGVFEEYFGKDGMAECNHTCVRVLSTDQTRVWAMFVVLYTLGVVAFVVESDLVEERVQSAVNALWPCIRDVALGNHQS